MNKKKLYESIMASVAKDVKKALNELSSENFYYDIQDPDNYRFSGREVFFDNEYIGHINDIDGDEQEFIISDPRFKGCEHEVKAAMEQLNHYFGIVACVAD